jgi:Domain of unknown function (DUF5076)
MTHELRIPEEVLNDSEARELLRVWISGDVQRFALRPDAWSDPAAWGLLLVDLARQVVRGYVQKLGGDPEAVLARIKEGFDAEWTVPTDVPPGSQD